VVENVVGSTSSKTCHESQLLSDMLMLSVFTGAERDEVEWKKLKQVSCFINFLL